MRILFLPLLTVLVTAYCAAQTPIRELDIPYGTALTGLGQTAMPFSAQSLWSASGSGPAQLIWSVPLGINITDVTMDVQNPTSRFFLQSDGAFYAFSDF